LMVTFDSMSKYTGVWLAFPIWPGIYECCFLNFIICCWNSSSFLEYSPGSLCSIPQS
jgi:hypothetical protein